MVIDLAEMDITLAKKDILAEMVWPFRPKKVTSAYVALAEMTIYRWRWLHIIFFNLDALRTINDF